MGGTVNKRAVLVVVATVLSIGSPLVVEAAMGRCTVRNATVPVSRVTTCRITAASDGYTLTGAVGMNTTVTLSTTDGIEIYGRTWQGPAVLLEGGGLWSGWTYTLSLEGQGTVHLHTGASEDDLAATMALTDVGLTAVAFRVPDLDETDMDTITCSMPPIQSVPGTDSIVYSASTTCSHFADYHTTTVGSPLPQTPVRHDPCGSRDGLVGDCSPGQMSLDAQTGDTTEARGEVVKIISSHTIVLAPTAIWHFYDASRCSVIDNFTLTCIQEKVVPVE